MPVPENSTKSEGGLLARLSERLTATRRAMSQGFAELIGARRPLDPQVLEDLEATLLQADVGIVATGRIVERVRRDSTAGGDGGLRAVLRAAMLEIIGPCEQPLAISGERPYVIMVVGVNARRARRSRPRCSWSRSVTRR